MVVSLFSGTNKNVPAAPVFQGRICIWNRVCVRSMPGIWRGKTTCTAIDAPFVRGRGRKTQACLQIPSSAAAPKMIYKLYWIRFS